MVCFNSGDKDTHNFGNCAKCKIFHAKRQEFTATLSLIILQDYFCKHIIKFDYGTPNYSK